MGIKTFAAIDVGSFELEMGIYEISSKTGIRRIDHLRHVIALGRETYSTGKISYKLVTEMCDVLKEFREIMEGYRVGEYRAYATSAMREAKNNQIILDQIRVRTGIDVQIISNSEQRFISYKAVASKDAAYQNAIQKGTAIVDISFGSMQISLFDKDALVSTQNLPLGVLRIREMLSHVHASRRVLNSVVEELIDNELFTFKKMYLKDRQIDHLIGIGESILFMSRQIVDARDKEWISASEFNQFYNRLLDMTIDQIEDAFDVNREYASILVPSAIIYKRILDLTGADMFWVPAIRLCDGIAAEYGEEKKLIKFNHSFSQDMIVTSRNMAKRYKCNQAHTQMIEQFVLDIYDSMRRYHGLGDRERLLLQIAANLHSCGKYISMKSTSESAYNIIMSTEIIGLSHLEREIIANVVYYNLQPFRYNEVHIEGGVYKEAGRFTESEVTILIAKLTAILRLANSMDRSHKQKLKNCKMRVLDGQLRIQVDHDEDMTLERVSIEQKSDFFEEIFGLRPILKQKKKI